MPRAIPVHCYDLVLFVSVFELANSKNIIVRVHVTTVGSNIYNNSSDAESGAVDCGS